MTELSNRMPSRGGQFFHSRADVNELPPSSAFFSFNLANLRRYFFIIASAAAVFIAFGLIFITVRSVSYSSSVRMIVDHRNLQLTQDNTVLVTALVTLADVDSLVEILRSGNITARAFELASRTAKDDFLPRPGLGTRLKQRFGLEKPENFSSEQLKQIAIIEFKKRVTIKRVAETFTIEIASKFPSPDGAALIATTIADAYLEDQARITKETADGTSAWLRNRIKGTGITARIISTAVPPLAPDGPSSLIVLVAALIAGVGAGFGLSLVLEYLGKTISTPEQAQYFTEAEWLGALPAIKAAPSDPRNDPGMAAASFRTVVRADMNRWPLVDPSSAQAETMNRVCMAAIVEGKGLKTIGVTSFSSGDGKTTVALNLARIASLNGQRALLVDAVYGKSDLTANMASSASSGLGQVLSGDLPIQEAVFIDPETGFHFLPLVQSERQFALAWLWVELSTQLAGWLQIYDLIVFDLPTITEQASYCGAANTLNGILFVLEKDKVRLADAERLLVTAGRGRSPYRGVMFNKAKRG